MIAWDSCVVLFLPRSGTHWTRNATPVRGSSRLHLGWRDLDPELQGRSVLAFLRDPWSWYESWAYFMASTDPGWRVFCGFGTHEPLQAHRVPGVWERVLRTMTWAEYPPGMNSGDPRQYPQAIAQDQERLGCGLWSWWVLHLLATSPDLDSLEVPLVDATVVWKDRRFPGTAITALEGHGVPLANRLPPGRVNASRRPVDLDWDPTWTSWVDERDGEVWRRVVAQYGPPEGVFP